MFHDRIVRTVLAVTAGYVIVLAVWLGWLYQYTEEGTAGYQIGGLLAAYGATLGAGMMWANRPSHADRKLAKHGMEGWATVTSAQPLARTADHGQLTALQLQLVVPGEESYTGRVVYEVAEEDLDRIVPGATVTVMVDPKNRARIMLCP